jgi:hypothetical protein
MTAQKPSQPTNLPDPGKAREQFRRFLAGETGERIFTHPTGHPSRPTGFCPCDRPLLSRLWFYLKAAVLVQALKLPFNRLKVGLLRRCGACIGPDVYLSVDVWIDPAFPELLTIEPEVMVGVGARIFLHEFRPDRFLAGRVIIRSGAVIGGCSLIGPGVEIGRGAIVVGGAVVGRDVPAGMMAVGNPARIMPLRPGGLTAGGAGDE